VRLEELGKLGEEKLKDLIGNRTRDLPACSLAPQPLHHLVLHEFPQSPWNILSGPVSQEELNSVCLVSPFRRLEGLLEQLVLEPR
jgi:hypothetical protein